MHRSTVILTVLLAGTIGPVAAAFAQCTSTWDTTIGNPGFTSGYAAPMRAWDDGVGQRIYVGGSFPNIGGNSSLRYAAAWDPATAMWSPLGSGITQGFTNAFMTSFVPFDPGTGERLVAGGFFDAAGGLPGTSSLAMWNGTSWEAMGTNWTGSTRGSIWSMAVFNDRLFVGGGVVNTDPTTGGGYPIGGEHWAGIASWDGQAWQSHATALTGSSPMVGVMQVFDDGTGPALYAGGRFNSIDGVPNSALLARWNGEVWSAVGGGLSPTSGSFGLEGMVVFDDGKGPALYIAGYTFIPAGQPATNIARWDGQQWSAVGPWIGNSRVTSFAVFDDGDGPKFHVGGTGNALAAYNFFARLENWTGGTTGQWVTVDGGVSNWIFGLHVISDELYVAGNFTTAGGLPANGMAVRTSCIEACYANCDGSTNEPILTVDDFTCFINEFAAAQSLPHEQQVTHYANCDGSTTAPVLTVDDFTCFINEFAAGCP